MQVVQYLDRDLKPFRETINAKANAKAPVVMLEDDVVAMSDLGIGGFDGISTGTVTYLN